MPDSHRKYNNKPQQKQSKKLPALMFYPGDWHKEATVQVLDYWHRQFWFELILIMHDSEERGVLILNGNPMTDEDIANILNLDNQITTNALTKLKLKGTCSVRDDGAIFCRRMVRDEEIRQKRIKAGSMGGNPNLLKQNSTKGLSKKLANVKQKTEIETVNEIEYEDNLILHGTFDTPEIRKALEAAKGKLKESGRALSQITLDAACMNIGTPERLLKALWHTASLTKTKNIYAAPDKPGEIKKKSKAEQVLEMGANLERKRIGL